MTSAIDNVTGLPSAGDKLALRQTVQQAARETGVDFQYLLQTAQRESSLNPNLTVQTSSATGLFQFIEQTWLGIIKTDGARFGLSAEASQIERRADGGLVIHDQQARQAILDLRKDPEIASRLAGALTQRNESFLERTLGRSPSSGELYVAHFLGARGATELIKASVHAPQKSAAELFPDAARANGPIFYENGGRARTVLEVKDELVRRHEVSATALAFEPTPERALASHTEQKEIPSRILASGPEATFLASHFGSEVNAYSSTAASREGAFAAVLGNQATFFAPKHREIPVTDNGGRSGDVIPSRYGRIEAQNVPSIASSNAEIKQTPVGPVKSAGQNEPVATAAASSAVHSTRNDEVILYPSVFNRENTVVVTSSEFGQTDLPLDLSRYLKVNRGR